MALKVRALALINDGRWAKFVIGGAVCETSRKARGLGNSHQLHRPIQRHLLNLGCYLDVHDLKGPMLLVRTFYEESKYYIIQNNRKRCSTTRDFLPLAAAQSLMIKDAIDDLRRHVFP